MDRKSNNVNTFWLSYRDAVMASGMPEKTAEWYVRWAQKFASCLEVCLLTVCPLLRQHGCLGP